MLFILRGDIFSSFYWIKVCLGINIGQRGLHKKEIRLGETINQWKDCWAGEQKEREVQCTFPKGLTVMTNIFITKLCFVLHTQIWKKTAIMYANTLSDPAMSHLSEVGFINNGRNVPHDIH